MKVFIFLVLALGYASAHNLQHSISHEKSVTIALHFANEGDFSFQSYEIYAPSKTIPFQVGRTDTHSRLSFLPDTSGKWKVKLFSEDGHGKIIEVDVNDTTQMKGTVSGDSSIWRSLLGLLLLLSVFGVIYFMKKESN